jgi:hypothetical protein
MQGPSDYLHTNYGGPEPQLFKRSLRYLGFRTVEGIDQLVIDTRNVHVRKSIETPFDISLLFETESEIGQLISEEISYRVTFKSWDDPQLEELWERG